jgi:hypothetical protein
MREPKPTPPSNGHSTQGHAYPSLASNTQNTIAGGETVVRLYSVREVAERLGVSEAAFRIRLCRHHNLFDPPLYRRASGYFHRVRVLMETEAHLLMCLVTLSRMKGL